MKHLTEKEAWWYLGMAYYKEPEERNKVESWFTKSSLCWAIWKLNGKEMISGDTENNMIIRIYFDNNDRKYKYVYPVHNRNSDFLRGDYCFLQLYMIETGD